MTLDNRRHSSQNAIASLDRHKSRRRIDEVLSSTSSSDFMDMIWLVNALQSGRHNLVYRLFDFPVDAVTQEYSSNNFIYPWELETIVGYYLTGNFRSTRKRRIFNTRHFSTMARMISALRKLENAEYCLFSRRVDVMMEVYRLSYRQFPWQRGFSNIARLYRYSFIYGRGECGEAFHRKHKLSYSDFVGSGFQIYAQLNRTPRLYGGVSSAIPGIRDESIEIALSMMATDIQSAQRHHRQQIIDTRQRQEHEIPLAYQPSILRSYPIIRLTNGGNYLCSPLPDLIMNRITSGAFYEVVNMEQKFLEMANTNFEDYCKKFVLSRLPSFECVDKFKYRLDSRDYESPDLLLSLLSHGSMIIECKASRTSFDAQFSNDPVSKASAGHKQLAKGVFQIWRFLSHLRKRIGAGKMNLEVVHGILLTLDPWLLASGETRRKVIDDANALADKQMGIEAEDRINIVFCSIEELENTLLNSDDASFTRVIEAAKADRFFSWALPRIAEESEKKEMKKVDYPFDPGEILPWWSSIKQSSRS